MSEFCVVGGGGHARVLIHGLLKLGHQVHGYTALHDEGNLMGARYLGSDMAFHEHEAHRPVSAVLGMGKVSVAGPRLARFEQYRARGFRFPAIYTVGAIVHDDVRAGAGTVILDGAVVVTGSRLGQACIVNTRATVDHDCELGNDVHVAPGATLSGGVVIGDHCMIGTGANIIHSVRVCAGCLIGAGATVTRDIVMPGTYVGVPARRIS
ncbi:NeuD/PglB/VioB family sugar acetyltransferase [Halomonas sp. YLGW01]|uniref:NeuD/PglB/VioB family sugar acetyltransferase n=1 Tax=Halomonas sp. YLGW01 TaxID=2773308 RepID=UPI001786438A|nr:NeuD/PglB/VioB family sugar acetyltransferase [Halomonas sp. YLGW01]